jgi:hypothetical protein
MWQRRKTVIWVKCTGLPLEGWTTRKKDLTKDGQEIRYYSTSWKANPPTLVHYVAKKKKQRTGAKWWCRKQNIRLWATYDEDWHTVRRLTRLLQGRLPGGRDVWWMPEKCVPDKGRSLLWRKVSGHDRAAVYCCVNLEQDNSGNSECNTLKSVCWASNH